MAFDWLMRIFLGLIIFTTGAFFGVVLMALMEASRR